jgi:dephospho-CoA kinase
MQRRNKNKPPPRRSAKNKLILGVTGSFGSGKSKVARMLSTYGARVIDADIIAHRVSRPGSKIYRKLINAFGCAVLQQNKNIDRRRLASLVFNNKELLRVLNDLIHPEVIRIIKERIKTAREKLIVLDAPLLIEAGLAGLVDKLIVVKVKRDIQIARVRKKMHLSEADILKRIRHQIPLREKIRLADFIIDNSGSIARTKEQVGEIWNRIHSRI